MKAFFWLVRNILSEDSEAKPIDFCSRRLLKLLVQNLLGDRRDTKIQLSFDVCYMYIIKSLQGLVELLYCSWLLESLFFPRSIENSQ